MERLTLSSSQYVFGGVCGGLAEYFDVDPVFVRLGFLLFAFIEPFTTTFVYTLLYFLMPDKSPNKKSREAIRQMRRGNMNEYSSVEELKRNTFK